MIDPALLKPIADELHATLIESNYMDSARSNAAAHLATAKSLGYDKVAPIDILDAERNSNSGAQRLPPKELHYRIAPG